MTSSHSPQRVLMTTDTVGGVWHYALELCRGLAACDVEVVLATMGPLPTTEQRAAAAAIPRLTVCESEFRLEWMEEPWMDVARAGEWLLGLESKFAPDVIHLNGYSHGKLAWKAPVVIVAHSCVLSWWAAICGGEAPAQWSTTYHRKVRGGLRAADRVIAPTAAMKASLITHYGEFGECEVIPNGRSGAEFQPGKKEPFVLSVGRMWDDAKNAQALAAAAPRLLWPVRVAGENRGPGGCTRKLPNIECLGPCAPTVLAGLYARASIYALPARYEPFGLSVLEAALSGCALVLGDIPSLRELWDGAAIFVSPNDSAALSTAINKLIRDSNTRHSLEHRARERAATFTVERKVTAYLAAYQRAIASAVPAEAVPVLSA